MFPLQVSRDPYGVYTVMGLSCRIVACTFSRVRRGCWQLQIYGSPAQTFSSFKACKAAAIEGAKRY